MSRVIWKLVVSGKWPLLD